MCEVFINKTTGGFVVPSLGVTGSWDLLERLLICWFKNRVRNKAEARAGYPKVERPNMALPEVCAN